MTTPLMMFKDSCVHNLAAPSMCFVCVHKLKTAYPYKPVSRLDKLNKSRTGNPQLSKPWLLRDYCDTCGSSVCVL
jgi:hypothetical protein